MSSRPVPRRDSPWGLPEGDTRQPKAHRCNDRAQDVIQVYHMGKIAVRPLIDILLHQMEEPTEPFTYLDLDPPKKEEAKLE